MAQAAAASAGVGDDAGELARLDTWMAAHVPGYRGPLRMQAFAGGQSNPTYELITPGPRYVMRRKPKGKLLSSAHAVDREHRIIAALHPTGFPVPRPFGLCEDAAVMGTPFYVMERVEGRIFRDVLLPDAAPEERRAIWMSMVGVLARLHSYDPAELGLADYGRPGNYMGRQVERWTKQYRASQSEELPYMERLIAWLPTRLPEQERTTLVHGDYKLDNVVIDADRPELKAVLDWELSTTGEPICDVTYLLMNWVNGPIGELDDRAERGFPSIEEIVGEYCRLTGRAGLPELDWYFAYNLFRSAAIIQGILGRIRDGTANDPNAAVFAERMPRLTEAGWRFAERAGA